MVPVNMTAALMDALGVPPADAYCPEAPEWMTEEQYEQWLAEQPSTEELVEELSQDPDVQAILEAAGPGGRYFDIER